MNPFVPSFAPDDRLTSSTSHLFADLILGGGLLVLVVVAAALALRAWSNARGIDAEVWRRKGLRRGPILLPGVAEPASDDGAEPFVELVITQVGTQRRTKNGHYVSWAERERSLSTRPFHLRTDGGELVRVEPGSQVVLVDRLDVTERVDHTTRRRRARVTPGERVWVRGVLEPPTDEAGGPYRGGGPTQWRLRPAKGQGLFISSEPVAHEGLAAARFHLGFAAGYFALLLFFQLVLYRPYHLLRHEGVKTEAVVRAKDSYTTRYKSRIIHHYVLHLVYEAGGTRHDTKEETGLFAYSITPEGARVPLVYAAGHPDVAQLGRDDELGFTFPRASGGSMLAVLLSAAYGIAASARRPWWRRKKLTETTPGML